ncbi:hypothetical protein SSX86_003038 [Deinandra increscens subsp. villosa]|uniref:Uncharacterized protein n=1 Tax=Deinandra increscens subsp. villosa TaxID=3103831 RepID=A0AAP0DKD3_9ASTR
MIDGWFIRFDISSSLFPSLPDCLFVSRDQTKGEKRKKLSPTDGELLQPANVKKQFSGLLACFWKEEEEKKDDGASVTTSCLAISEQKPRRTGGCVAVFFQLFDWNRRFAKKKRFSKRLLPPVRTKQASNKFGRDEKLPNPRLIADENSNKNNGFSGGDNIAPGLVARLMGLESMPCPQRDKKLVGENDELDKKLTKHDFRPQKLQKTGVVDTTSVNRFGAEALQLKNVISRSRKNHHPKLASPVQKTNHQSKRNASRLIGAATRVLESGLQARNKSISYGARSRVKGVNLDLLSQQASCKNCGSSIDVSELKSKRDVDPCVLKSCFDREKELQPQSFASPKGNNERRDDDGVSFQSKVKCLPFNGETKDFVALNRSLTGQTRSRVPGKVEDMKFDKRDKFEKGSSQRQKRRLMRNGPRMVNNAQSTRKQIGSETWKPDYIYQRHVANKNSDEMAFRFNSTMKNRCEIPTKFDIRRTNRKRSSKPSEEKICLQKPFYLTGDSLGALIEEKLQEVSSKIRYDSRINENSPKRRPATRNNMEFSPKKNHLPSHSRCWYDHNTRFCVQTKSQTAAGLIGRKSSDHLSPGSVLKASFSNESCCSSSLEDSSVQTHHADYITCSYEESQFQESEMNPLYSNVLFRKENTHNKLAVDLLTYISQVLSTIDSVHSRISGNTRAHIKRVIFNSELVLSNQMPHNPTELNSFFICDLLLELDTLAEGVMTKFGNFLCSQNPIEGYELKRFVFDAVIEYLESKYERYSKCGFGTWMNLASFMGFDVLVHEVVEEVRRWMGFVGVISDELVEMDMSHCLGKWTDFEIEVYETGAKIESDILQMLVDEIVVDIRLVSGLVGPAQAVGVAAGLEAVGLWAGLEAVAGLGLLETTSGLGLLETTSDLGFVRSLSKDLDLPAFDWCGTLNTDSVVSLVCASFVSYFFAIMTIEGDVGTSATLVSKLDASDPLYLHASDSGHLTVISIKLKGTENYRLWSNAMKLALKVKNKYGFIDGTCVKPTDDDVLARQWDRCNSIVLTWLLNSVSEELYLGHVYSNLASSVWNELKDTYDKVDGSVVFDLYQNINCFSQNGLSVSEYYHKLNIMWKQLDQILQLPSCTCEASKQFNDFNHLIKLMQFLMGLDETYRSVRTNLLVKDELPTIKEAFSILSREESHRNSSSETSKGTGPYDDNNDKIDKPNGSHGTQPSGLGDETTLGRAESQQPSNTTQGREMGAHPSSIILGRVDSQQPSGTDPTPEGVEGETSEVDNDHRFEGVSRIHEITPVPLKRSTRQSVLPAKFNDFVIEGKELKLKVQLPVELFCDNNAAISIALNPVFHDRTKHFELDLFFLRDQIAKGCIKVVVGPAQAVGVAVGLEAVGLWAGLGLLETISGLGLLETTSDVGFVRVC